MSLGTHYQNNSHLYNLFLGSCMINSEELLWNEDLMDPSKPQSIGMFCVKTNNILHI